MTGPPEAVWGRWGAEDERGALNLIEPATVAAAARLVRSGEIFDLGLPLDAETPVAGHRIGVHRFMTRDGGDYAAGAKRPGGFQFCEDAVLMPTHAGTHVDALAHVWHDDLLYNGFPGDGTRSTTGAQRCGADKLGPIVGRGLLLDVAASRTLERGEAVTAPDLETARDAAGVELEPGDVVLVRTGWLGARGGDEEYFAGEPGLDLGAARWLADADVALIGADNFAVEQIPFPDGAVFPVHQHLLRDRGVPLLEGVVLDALAAAGASAFMFAALPLRLRGSSASPLSPVAIL